MRQTFYFGDKNALFTAAVAEMLAGLQSAVESQLRSEESAEERGPIRSRIGS